MNKTISTCAMIAATAVWIILSLCAPWALSDSNTFLMGFVSHELLGFLSVVVTITLASAANLHLELNKLEEQIKKRVFTKTRATVKKSAYWLIGMLIIALFLVVIKPFIPNNEMSQSFVNGGALLIVFLNILVLIDIVQMVFLIEPKFDDAK